MKKKNGFIAISLIYSFFLVFLMTLIAVLTTYAQNRVLVNRIVSDTKEYLNNLAENDDTRLTNQSYTFLQNVTYAGLSWQVLEDNDLETTLLLNRSLTSTELNTVLANMHFSIAHTGASIRMCLNTLSDFYCYQISDTSFSIYNWQNSIVKAVAEAWLQEQIGLTKAMARNSLVSMSINTNGVETSGWIRIMSAEEANLVGDSNTWTYTYRESINGVSYIENANGDSVSTISEYTIRPIIKVKKLTK